MTTPKVMVKAVAPVVGLTRKFVDRNVGYPLASTTAAAETS
jgi:hypothetical protein